MCRIHHRWTSSFLVLSIAMAAQPVMARQADQADPREAVGNGQDQDPDSEDDAVRDEDELKSMSSDAIFQRMFGKQPPPVETNSYTVVIDGVNEGEALIDPREDGWIEAGFLRREVLPLLRPDAADALRAVLVDERIPFSALQNLTYEVSFDSRDLILTMQIPLDLRGERVLMLSRRRDQQIVDAIPQADLSAYVSVRGGLDWIQQSPVDDTGLSGFVADIDTAMNFRGVVLEGEFRYSQNDRDRRFSRGDVRLTYDDVDSLVRYEAGDLSLATRTYQSAPNIAGIAAYREFRIDPYLDPRPVGERGLVLERAAQVDIIVNGARSRTINLPAGRYSIRDFPIVPSAINDVEFVVTYASGEVERFVFPAFTSIDLLEEGRSEFAVNLGVPFEDVENVRRYDTDNFNLVGFYRKGLTSTLTAGVSVEADKDLLVVGGEASWASPIGSIGVTLSNNLRDPGLESTRLALQYSYLSADPFTGMSIDGLLILTGDDYRTLDRLFGDGGSRIYASGRVGKVIDSRTRVQVGGSYQLSTDFDEFGDRSETWTASASLTRQFGRVNVTGGMDYRTGSGVGSEWIGRVSLFIPLGRGTATSSYSTRNNTFRADYRRASRSAVGSFGYAAGFQRTDDGDLQSIRANYIGNRFEASVEQLREASGGEEDIRTGLAFGTALVMADGRFAISRPVENGFAIIENGTDIEARLAIDPRGSPFGGKRHYGAYSDFLGPAVISDLPPYFVRRLEVEAPDAPAGAGLEGEVFVLKPGFRGGYALTVGTQGGSVSALGNLVFADGSPAAMLSGSVRKMTGVIDPSGDVDTEETNSDGVFFTNSGGRFFVEGLDPGGRYEVILTIGGDPQRFVLSAPEEVLGIWRIEEPIVIGGSAPEGEVDAGPVEEMTDEE